jgi:hypothetical protein
VRYGESVKTNVPGNATRARSTRRWTGASLCDRIVRRLSLNTAPPEGLQPRIFDGRFLHAVDDPAVGEEDHLVGRSLGS